jgi:hypothetical protein
VDQPPIPAALANFTAGMAEELALTYTDQVVYPRHIVIDPPGAPDRRFPAWPTPVLLLAIENQGVCAWGLPLDGDDNPPVIVSGERSDGSDTTIPYAADLDAYVAARRWDNQCLSSPVVLQAQADPVDPTTLAYLHANYEQLPSTTGWPGELTYRFRNGPVRIMLWAGADQCDWFISGTDTDQLANATAAVLPCSDLRTSLWSNDTAGQQLLHRLRRTQPPN